nr:DUF4238 domain-containing protein [Agrobacterium vitis]
MNNPKRHHWWPQLQSGHWCAADGLITVTPKNGEVFRASPLNVGLQGHLYTMTNEDGTPDPAIEKWLADHVDGPFSSILDSTFSLKKVFRRRFRADPKRAKAAREVGYRITPYLEIIRLSLRERMIISNYVASLLVRNPYYLQKLESFHRGNLIPSSDTKNSALRNMLSVYKIYRKAILRSEFILEVRDGTNEYLFGDSGVTADEPWTAGIPFDLHVPLTPDMALEIFPAPTVSTMDLTIARVGNTVVSRHNLAVVGDAQRFVYSKGLPPLNFIHANFSKPAPAPFGHRIVNGELEVTYDRTKDRKA